MKGKKKNSTARLEPSVVIILIGLELEDVGEDI